MSSSFGPRLRTYRRSCVLLSCSMSQSKYSDVFRFCPGTRQRNSSSYYLLTALIHRPKRLIYLSSGLHRSGDISLEDLAWERRPWNGAAAYSDSKLHDVLLAFAVARHWPEVLSNALEPGWVPTKMGGPGAPDDLDAGHRTQVWLAVSDDAAARVSGKYFYHLRPRSPHPAVFEVERQEKLLDACCRFSGVRLPA
jgi:NAD(P)-dependent dehydrogenase (short-subunit alcohol dehydrogenase family)